MSSKEILIKKSHLTPTVLIAGAGFIGSHLAERLLVQNVRVVAVDTFAKAKDSLLKNPKFIFFDADINEGLPDKIKSVDYVIDVSLDSSLANAFGVKNLLELAKRSEAKFLLVTNLNGANNDAQRFAEALTQEYYKHSQVDARIVRLPNVYGPRMDLQEAGNFGTILGQAIKHRDLIVEGDGTEKEYYLYVSDAVDGLAKALFGGHTEGEVFSLVPDEPSAALEVAYLVKNLADAGLKVKFTGKDRSRITPDTPDTKNLHTLRWEPKVGMKDGLTKTMLWLGYTPNEHGFKPTKLIESKKKEKSVAKGEQIMTLAGLVDEVKQSIESISAPVVPPAPVKKSKKFKFKRPSFVLPTLKFPALAIIAAAIAVLALPFALTTAYSAAGASNLKKAENAVLGLDSEIAKDYSNRAFKNFSRGETSFAGTKWIFQLLGRQNTYTSYGSLLTSAKYFSKAAYDSTKATAPFTTLFDAVKPTSTVVLDAEGFKNSELLLTQAKTNFDRAYGDFKNIDANSLPKFLSEKISMYESALKGSVNFVDTAAALSAQIPDLLGVTAAKTYLVLFQNSNEIRPTGGFIGSYALVDVQNGKISSITIDDIYNPDGQIDVRDIQVTPPAPLAENLEEDRLYIRNANWNPDFVKSAQTIRDLYFRVTGKNVDGVIAVDLGFVQELLNVTGPVYLTAFGEEISSANLYERTQFHSEFNFESGSDQKRQFLTVLGGKVLETLFSLPQDKMPDLLKSLSRLLAEKHLLVSLPGNPLSLALAKHGWDGGLVKTAGDYLYIVNANVGGTKANYFVKNEMKYQVSSQTRDGILRSTLTLNYKHTGTDNAWPGGPYKDYVRVLVQNGSKLTNATLGKVGESGENIFENMIISSEGDYTSFEYLIELAPQDELNLTLYYDLPTNLALTKDNKNYALYWQKQPGTQADPITFIFEPPFGTTTDTETQAQTTLNTDKAFGLTVLAQ